MCFGNGQGRVDRSEEVWCSESQVPRVACVILVTVHSVGDEVRARRRRLAGNEDIISAPRAGSRRQHPIVVVNYYLIVGKFYPASFDFMHLYFWQATLIVMITSVWALWIFKVVIREPPAAAAG